MDGATEPLHATAIAVDGRAALICGPSGSGKSDLALRCLTLQSSSVWRGAVSLVADDRTLVARRGMVLTASAPEAIAGRLEVRGLGILRVANVREATVALIVQLGSTERQPRFPDPWPTAEILGLAAPVLRLAPFEASAAAKVVAALALADLPNICESRQSAVG